MKARLKNVVVRDIVAAVDYTYTEVQDNVQASDESPEIALATGFSRRRGTRKAIDLSLLHAQAFTDMRTICEARKELKITFTFDDGTIAIEKVRAVAVPILSAIPDMSKVYFGDMTATGDPTSGGTGWEDAGYVLGGSQANPAVNSIEDGMQRPLHNFATIDHVMEVPAATLADIRTMETARTLAQVAIIHPDDSFRLYKNVYLEARVLPNPQPGAQAGSIQLRVFGAKKSFSDLITFPTGPEDHFYGCRLTGSGFHYEESSLVTEA